MLTWRRFKFSGLHFALAVCRYSQIRKQYNSGTSAKVSIAFDPLFHDSEPSVPVFLARRILREFLLATIPVTNLGPISSVIFKAFGEAESGNTDPQVRQQGEAKFGCPVTSFQPERDFCRWNGG